MPWFKSGLFLGALISVLAALFLTVFLIAFNAPDPARALRSFLVGPWSSPWFAGNTLDYIALLLTASLSAGIAIRSGLFNLGGEGQIYTGGLAASAVLLMGNNQESSPASVLLLFAAAVCGMASGAFMGGISGLLKRFAGANELITSFLLSAALTPMADYLISGPLRDPSGNLLALPALSPALILPRLLPPSNLSVSVTLAAALVVLAHLFFNKTSLGYRCHIVGSAPDFAAYAGIEVRRYWTPVFCVSGALSGLAGFFAVAGTYGRCHLGFPGGMGWNAIAVALISRNRALALFPAALVYGWFKSGADSSLLSAGMNFETSSFIQAAVLLLATVHFSLPQHLRFFRRRRLGDR
ncbi:ABC transporter permease [Breznakiellaceae bacterium SP9]